MSKALNTIRIEPPEPSDVPTMVAWGRSTSMLWASSDDPWYSPKWLKRWIKDPKHDVLLVARVGKKLAGMCFVHHMGEWAYCSTLFVDSAYRSLGIGTKLLDAAHKRIKQTGVNYFALLVKEDNKDSHAFYKKRGFSEGYKFIWMYKNK